MNETELMRIMTPVAGKIPLAESWWASFVVLLLVGQTESQYYYYFYPKSQWFVRIYISTSKRTLFHQANSKKGLLGQNNAKRTAPKPEYDIAFKRKLIKETFY